MAAQIRQLQPSDASKWLELFKHNFGEEYQDKQAYDPSWISAQFGVKGVSESWGAEVNGRLVTAVSFLPPLPENNNPIANLGRHLILPEAHGQGAAEQLLRHVNDLAAKRGQVVITRVLASDNAQQVLYEREGYVCVGFQPFKHMTRVREGSLFYLRPAQARLGPRMPISESLPQIHELATGVLGSLNLPLPPSVRDGAVGYPLQSELKFHDATFDDFELWRIQAESANPPVEISGAYNFGLGYLRSPPTEALRAVLAQREDKVIGGLAYAYDPFDRCVRISQAFSQDDLSAGALFQRVVKIAQDLSAIYIEVDILMTAPRLLKSAEQLGFVPVAYMPGFYLKEDKLADVVKMIKLNVVYSVEKATFTSQAQRIVEIVDHNFQDQKVGVAIINLLRGLPIFEGLGDGELRKIARLFTQKLFRPGERIFKRGDSGNEAYVVMRGQIDIQLDERSAPIATIGNGQIFGELAFLDGADRVALAVATQPSILLVVQRSAFNALAQREPHLGMVVMRNVAMELSNRLRKTNAAITGLKK